MKFALSSVILLLSTSFVVNAAAIEERQIFNSVTSVVGGAFSTATSVAVGVFTTATSGAVSVFESVTSAAPSEFTAATSNVFATIPYRIDG
jgi:hypothetical protein